MAYVHREHCTISSREASTDRRYLLYNPTSKMKVTLQAEEVINLLWDVITAKGFEKDTYFSISLPLGEMFAIVVYGQLILEQAGLDRVDPEIVNQIFDFMVRDFAHFALQIYGMHACREDQRAFCRDIMLIRAIPDSGQYARIWQNRVMPLNGEYRMND